MQLTHFFRNKVILRSTSATLLFAFAGQILFPFGAYAIGGGPSQPEATGFTQASASDMVDPFTGDFNYNIPLLDVDGYPINLAYSSGISMEQEATWVGLGWTLNVGALNRSMRGVPDEFKGDVITKEINIKNNHTFGIDIKANTELIGADKTAQDQGDEDEADKKEGDQDPKNEGEQTDTTQLKPFKLGKLQAGLGISWNNYTGTGVEISISPPINASRGNFGLTGSLGIKASSASGASFDPQLSLSREIDGKSTGKEYSYSIGFPYNSVNGFSQMDFGLSIKKGALDKKTGRLTPNAQQTYSGGSSLSFEYPFQIPQTRMNMFNTNLSIITKFGLAAYGIHGNVSLKGYYAGQFLVDKTKNIRSFGYLHTQHGQNDKEAMLDFNREKEGSYSKNTPRLPLTNYTYDVLSASGQGMAGTYRPYRNDVGVMRDDEVRSYSAGTNLPSMEFGSVATFHFGGNFTLNASDGYSGAWEQQNNIAGHLKATHELTGFNETYYYKKIGDKTPAPASDEVFLNKIKRYRPVRVNLTDKTQTARTEFEDTDGQTSSINATLVKNYNTRAKRNEPLFAITNQEHTHALNLSIRTYNFISSASPVTHNVMEVYQDHSRLSRPEHHITEYTAVNTNGARFVYGIPAYNNFQKDVTFAVPSENASCSYSDLISYNPVDDSKENSNGLDNYYEQVTTPAYAHSYLLTAVLSDDYADLTHNGPSDDDKGTYTKFNYSRIDGFKWRAPFTPTEDPDDEIEDKTYAYYNPGIGANKLDDRASYVYGEKELWYLHSVETKNYIAVFVTENRDDGYGAKGKAGGRGGKQSKLLRRIELYVKSDLLNTAGSHTPIPVKVVHFDYSYALCKGVPSNSNEEAGKLTLKKVYFTYGNSTRAMSRGYGFDYREDEPSFNPDYANKAADRWGTYKPSSTLASNADYPYAEQNKELADQYAAAWNLSVITLPSGGTITVNYEADDYGFVQNRRAMQMFTVLGSSLTQLNNTAGTSANAACAGKKEGTLYELSTSGNHGLECSPYQYFYIELSEPVISREELKQKYFTDENGNPLKSLYFKFYVKTRELGIGAENYEAVPGYIKENDFDYGICTDGSDLSTKYAWIRLKPVNIGDYVETGNANPVSKAAWNFLRMRYPRLGQGRADYDPDEFNPLAIFQELSSSIFQVCQAFVGYFFTLRQENIARKFDCEKSVFRLYSPNYTKLGGGSRVKTITLDDKFSSITGNNVYANQTYGKEYSYKTMRNGKEISSGVASYEPLLGGEESPFKEPLIMGTDQKFMAIGNEFLQEGKFGESFFSMASVGYSKVTVRSLRKQNSRSTATGKEEHEFYTTSDFPNFVYETGVEAHRTKPDLLFTFVKFFSFDHMAVSQGYSVELNDMNGKPRSVRNFSEYNDTLPINSTEYFYKRDPQNLSKLYNQTTTVDSKGNIRNDVEAGVEIDIVADMREERSRTHGGSFGGNLEAFIAFVPMVLPAFFPKYTQEDVKFRSSVVTKVINRAGLMDSVVVKDNGARKITHNLAVDDESGEVLVTKINNNFNDPVYQVNLPAYWMYDEMGHAYKRMGAVFPTKDVLKNPSAYLKEGDEIAFGPYNAWVINTAPKLDVLSNVGMHYDISELMEYEDVDQLKIMRPGNHNKIMLPASSTIVKENPLTGTQLSFNEVIDANAKLYSDNWKIFCGCSNVIGKGYNPYISGRRGNYQVVKDYVFLTNRTQTRYNNNLNVRKDGVYTTFSPFWNYDNQWRPDLLTWTNSSESTIMSATGALLESRDALNRFSSAQFAFADRANIAIGQNAMYREIGFESFEDYDFLSAESCKEGHFTFYSTYINGVNGNLVGTKSDISLSRDSHSGKHAIKVSNQTNPGSLNYIKIRKIISPCK